VLPTLMASWWSTACSRHLEYIANVARYVEGLSPKKQDKALISARRAANIRKVLADKKATGVESAQFR
jgi:hypothetical protein